MSVARDLSQEPVEADSAMNQVTSVSQLSDVQPTDWAFQALQSLVERYGCVVGYPDGTYRGNRAMTRYEFAAGLNACMDRVNELIAAGTANLATKEDLATLQRLQEEFAAELATLRGRVDALEARTATLEAQQFSTTTKLRAEVIFAVVEAFTGKVAVPSGQTPTTTFVNNNLILGNRVRLNFDTSFMGKDRLRIRLQARNLTPIATGTAESRLSFDGSDNNTLGMEYLYYRFPLGNNTQVIVSAKGVEFDDVIDTINPFLEGSGNGSISRFGRYNPVYRAPGGGAGAVVIQRLGKDLELTLGYLAGNPDSPLSNNGLFNGNYSALGQLTYKFNNWSEIGLVYSHAYFGPVFNGSNGVDVTSGTGSANSRRPFGNNVPTASDSINFGASIALSPQVVLGGWFGYTFANAQVASNSADILNFSVNLAFPDLGKKGNLGAIIFGIPPKVTRNTIAANQDRDTSFHIEALYRYQINDYIAITPGVLVITSPEHNSANDTIYVGTIRTTFTF
ncbi:iron uptake porin [Leptolyngbya sp. 'hensonii']|uniref:iron uptake porin n=1 Tax=Leptolyngbya sp. 'hensonii' TaxID=1922337 RepID=UPI00209B414A|nr:iron uptake porin [Leptolyngbya sp. 'hensonii']